MQWISKSDSIVSRMIAMYRMTFPPDRGELTPFYNTRSPVFLFFMVSAVFRGHWMYTDRMGGGAV